LLREAQQFYPGDVLGFAAAVNAVLERLDAGDRDASAVLKDCMWVARCRVSVCRCL
jgi:hypothetical protein